MNTRELPHHIAICRMLELLQKQGQLIFWHTPMGEVRTKSAGAKLKAMGARAGVWDFIIMAKGLANTVLFVEVKTAGGKLSPAQTEFKAGVLEHQHSLWLTWRSLDDCVRDLRELGFNVPRII